MCDGRKRARCETKSAAVAKPDPRPTFSRLELAFLITEFGMYTILQPAIRLNPLGGALVLLHNLPLPLLLFQCSSLLSEVQHRLGYRRLLRILLCSRVRRMRAPQHQSTKPFSGHSSIFASSVGDLRQVSRPSFNRHMMVNSASEVNGTRYNGDWTPAHADMRVSDKRSCIMRAPVVNCAGRRLAKSEGAAGSSPVHL